MSQEDIGRAMGVAYTTVHKWVHARSKPQAAAKKKIQSVYSSAVARAAAAGNRAAAVTAQLHVEYGSPRLGNLEDPLDELFFILCSLKTTGRSYEETYATLASKYRPWRRLLDADIEDVQNTISRGGLASIKAKAFLDIAKQLKEDFGSVSLSRLKKMDAATAERYLLSLPGVGIKTARCVMLYSLGHRVVPVDTHTYRVGVRAGLVPTSRNPTAAHKHFDLATPPALAYALHVNSVAHGRAVCKDLRPECDRCVIASMCPSRVSDETRAAPRMTSPAAVSARSQPVAVDIYAGCGGLSLGIEQAGFDMAYALDWDKHACATHAVNQTRGVVECADVRTVTGEHILKAAGGRIDLVAGGPNCQGVSQRGLRSPDDPRNFMFPEFLRIVSELSPRMFLMENVPGLAHRHNFAMLREIFQAFEKLGYRCAADVLLAADYGVPQLRYRFFMIGTLGPEPLTLPAPTHFPSSGDLLARPFVTIADAIGDLPSPRGPNPGSYLSAPATDYQRIMRAGADSIYNHVVSATEDVNLRRASFVPAGGNWKDIPADLLPPRFFECRLTDHSTTYARPRWDMPSFTITSLFGNITAGAFTHPAETRAFSVREGARLQSFPDRFKFEGPLNSKYRQIGNAVPPLLAKAVAGHLRALMRGESPASKEPRITPALLESEKAWGALPVLTPRFKALFGTGTRWPLGWGPEPADRSTLLDTNYRLRGQLARAA